MNHTQNSFNEKSKEENKNFSSGNTNENSEVQKDKERNKNFPDNFGSVRPQQGAMDQNQDPDAQDPDADVPEEDNDLGGPEYRDPPRPDTKAKRLE